MVWYLVFHSNFFRKVGYSVILFFIPLAAQAYIYIPVGEAQVRQSQMAIQPFVLKSNAANQSIWIGHKVFTVFQEDMTSSGYFLLIDQAAFLEKPGEKSQEPYPLDPNGFIWKNWQLLNTDYLVLGDYQLGPDNKKVTLNLFLYHVPLKKKVFQKQYTLGISQVEKLGHHIANDTIQALTTKRGPFLTKIVATRSMSGTKKELFVMDWNGKNKKQVSFHRSTVVAPHWSPDGQNIAYTSYLYWKRQKRRVAALILYNRLTKSRRIILRRKGVNLGFDFFPDGQSMLVSLFLGKGYLDIAKMNLQTRAVTPITFGPNGSINVEPVLHPNGQTILFSSDRGGRVALYSMNVDGTNIKLVTFQGNYNSTPDFSLDGKQAIFSGYSGGRFDIFIMNSDGSAIRRLTSFKKPDDTWADNESPSFSPDGRFVVFTSNRTGSYQLYIMNLHNQYIKQISSGSHQYKHPRWSPFLP